MNDVYGVLGTPGVGFFSLLIIGAIAGWIAEKVTKSDHGFLTNIIVGIAGSFIGSTLATSFNIAVNGGLARLLAAVVGAVILVYGWRIIKGRQNPQQQQGYGNQPNQPMPYDNNQPMPPQDGQQGQYGNPQQGQYNDPQGQYGNPQNQYGNPQSNPQGYPQGQQGQYGEPQGEWINEPPPGDGRSGQHGNQPPNNSPLDRR